MTGRAGLVVCAARSVGAIGRPRTTRLNPTAPPASLVRPHRSGLTGLGGPWAARGAAASRLITGRIPLSAPIRITVRSTRSTLGRSVDLGRGSTRNLSGMPGSSVTWMLVANFLAGIRPGGAGNPHHRHPEPHRHLTLAWWPGTDHLSISYVGIIRTNPALKWSEVIEGCRNGHNR